MGQYDDLFETATVITPPQKPLTRKSFFYFDIETIPDYERMGSFGLPELPPMQTELLAPDEFCSLTLAEIKRWFDEHSAPDWWLDQVETEENTAKKPRAGLFETTTKARNAVAERRKILSITPEYCRVAAIGYAANDSDVEAVIAEDEVSALQEFWLQIVNVNTLVGFNVLHFDLPVILTRSAILGVNPTRKINLSPFRNPQVCDLMLCRWPKGGQMKLKSVCRALEIEVPAEDCDGSQVESLYNTDKQKLRDYVISDVEITRELHQFWSGYFCD